MSEWGRLAGHKFTRETVERALNTHKNEGSIRHWQRNPTNTGHTVVLFTTDYLLTNTLRETAILVHGLGSVSQAWKKVPANLEEIADRLGEEYKSQNDLVSTVTAFKAGFMAGIGWLLERKRN